MQNKVSQSVSQSCHCSRLFTFDVYQPVRRARRYLLQIFPRILSPSLFGYGQSGLRVSSSFQIFSGGIISGEICPCPTGWMSHSYHPRSRSFLGCCRAMLCISAAYAITRCLSVCPSVCVSVTIVHSIKTNEHIFKMF